MSFLPSQFQLRGSTAGASTGENVLLSTSGGKHGFPLNAVEALTIDLRVVATGVISGTPVGQFFVQRFCVRQPPSFVTPVYVAGPLSQFGDSAASSWTLTPSVSSAPNLFKLSFGTGSTQARVNIVADLAVVHSGLLPLIPSGYVQWLRMDSGVTLSGTDVISVADLSSNHYDETETPNGAPTYTASDPNFNNQPTISTSGLGGQFTQTPPIPGNITQPAGTWTMALVGASGAGEAPFMSIGYLGGAGLAVAATSDGFIEAFTPGNFLSYTGSPASAIAVIFTVDGAGGGQVFSSNGHATTPFVGATSSPTAFNQLMTLNQGGGTSTVAEKLLWDRVLSVGEINNLMTYFSGRYNISLSG